MTSKQLCMFEPSREEVLEQRLNLLEIQMDKVRKNLFAKYTELLQLYQEQKDHLDSLKS
jgi:predicted glycoside hydrolase/deacetylase ChbG (UPF0249 family)